MEAKKDTKRLNLRQLTELEYILIGDLRDVLEEPSTEENRKWLLAIVNALLSTVPQEFALREKGGYLTDVLDTQPNWDSQVSKLQKEHRTLSTQLLDLKLKLEESRSFKRHADELKHDLHDWMNTLIAHNRHECRIMHTAICQEMGVGD